LISINSIFTRFKKEWQTVEHSVIEESVSCGELRNLSVPTVQKKKQHEQDSSLNLEALAVLAVGIAFFIGVAFHWSPLNGSLRLAGTEWRWRDLGIIHTALFLFVPFACISYVLWKAESRPDQRVSLHLRILALGNFLLQIMGIFADSRGFGLIQQTVLSPSATSYFTDAAGIEGVGMWLQNFYHASPHFHTSTHPPGPVLFYLLLLQMFGSPAVIGGCVVGCVGSLGVLVTYKFAGLWTEDQHTRLIASAFYALLPATTLFFPEMDQLYPILSMLLIFYWCRSLESKQRIPLESLCLGAILFLTTFFAYNLLTVGAFLACYGLYWVWQQGWTKSSWIGLLMNSGIAAGVCTAAYLVLWLATGFNPIASFFHALAYQAAYSAYMYRPYLFTAIFDPYDFFLGAGILALPLILFQLRRIFRDFDPTQKKVALTLIGLATILTVDLTGMLRGEAARVWLFLQPLVVVPVAVELHRFRWRWRIAIFSMQWLIVVCLKAKMFFIVP
jgi:hypothetical protein